MIYNSLNNSEEVNKNGFIQINDFFNLNDFKINAKYYKKLSSKKGGSSQFPLSIKSYIIKLIKFEIKKIYDSFLKKISKNSILKTPQMNSNEQTILQNIDTYYNNVSSEPVLDWHCDLSNKHLLKKDKILIQKWYQ